MNLQDLRARKTELDSTILQLASQWQTAQGHMGEVSYWIAKMEQAEGLPCKLSLDTEPPLEVE